MIIEKEPVKKELYYKIYMRMIEAVAAEHTKQKKEAENKRKAEEKKAHEEWLKHGKGSNVPIVEIVPLDINTQALSAVAKGNDHCISNKDLTMSGSIA